MLIGRFAPGEMAPKPQRGLQQGQRTLKAASNSKNVFQRQGGEKIAAKRDKSEI
jgi:hypothetical protein